MKPLVATALVAMATTAALAAVAGQVKVNPVVSPDGRLLTSFTAADTWTIDTRETLQLGTVVTFDYYVELRRPRLLFDSTLAQTNVKAEAKLDTLTGTYVVTRHRDGRIIRSEKRDVENEVRDWLTVFESVELEPSQALKANTDYYVQVRLFKYPRRSVSLWAVLPGGSEDSSGRTSFTYVR